MDLGRYFDINDFRLRNILNIGVDLLYFHDLRLGNFHNGRLFFLNYDFDRELYWENSLYLDFSDHLFLYNFIHLFILNFNGLDGNFNINKSFYLYRYLYGDLLHNFHNFLLFNDHFPLNRNLLYYFDLSDNFLDHRPSMNDSFNNDFCWNFNDW